MALSWMTFGREIVETNTLGVMLCCRQVHMYKLWLLHELGGVALWFDSVILQEGKITEKLYKKHSICCSSHALMVLVVYFICSNIIDFNTQKPSSLIVRLTSIAQFQMRGCFQIVCSRLKNAT